MEYCIREMKQGEYSLLRTFLYEAIFVPEGVEPPPFSILDASELQVYIQDFGTRKDDLAIVAVQKDKVIGAVWTRIMKDYGHVDEKTPSFAISLLKEYRGFGIGSAMMREMLVLLRQKGYEKASLAVQKDNYAVSMYQKLGFYIFDENEEEYIMILNL